MSQSDNNIQKSVRCKKCRTNLFLLKDHPLIDCHGLLVEQYTNKDRLSPPNNEIVATEPSNKDYICETQRDNSMIFLKEETYPPFIELAVNESAWQKGKLSCPKCKARLGSFNFVNVSHCSCQLTLLPAVHLQISKVDCLLPWDKVQHHISLALRENSDATEKVSPNYMTSAETLNDGHTSVEDMATTQFNNLNEEQVHEGSVVALKTDLEKSNTEAQVRGIKGSNGDQLLAQCVPKYIDPLHYLKNVSSEKGRIGHVSLIQRSSLEDKSELYIGETQLRKRKMRRKSLLTEPPFNPSLANSGLSNYNRDKEEVQSLKDCKSSEDISQSSNFLVLNNLNESEKEDEEEPNDGDKLLAAIPDNLLCPVCLDMLYSPFMVKPCSHIFCEPCLRRLAKRAPTNTSCPLCRELIGICNPCHDISKEIKEKYPEQLQERHRFEKLHESQHLPLPWIRDYRFRARTGPGRYGRNWTGWKTILWIFVLDCLGLALVLIIKWIIGDYEANLQQLDFQSKQRTLDTPSNLELQSSYSKSQGLFDIHNDSIFSNVIE